MSANFIRFSLKQSLSSLYPEKNSAYFSICSSFHLWCLHLNGECCIKKSVLLIWAADRQSAWASVCSVCVMSAPAHNCTSAQRRMSVFYTETEKERRAQTPRKRWANEESLSPLVACKAFQFACLSPLPIMSQMLLAMLTNYCNQTSQLKIRNSEGDRKDTLSSRALYVAKHEYMNNSSLNRLTTVVWNASF